MQLRLALLAFAVLAAVGVGAWLRGGSEPGRGARPASGAELVPAPRDESKDVASAGAVDDGGGAREPLAATAPREEGALVVRVRDVAGRALEGLELALRALPDGGRAEELARAGVGPDGLARVAGAGALLAGAEAERFELVPVALLRERAALALDGATPPADVLELTLPELGVVRVRVLEPGGGRWRFDASRNANPRVHLRDAARERAGPIWKEGALALDVDGPRALRGWVETGLEVEAVCSLPAYRHEVATRAAGPGRAFAEVELELRLGADHPVLRGRVLSPDGAPVRSELLELARSRIAGFAGARRGRSKIATDGDGVFRLAVEPLAADAVLGLRLRLRLRRGAEPPLELVTHVPGPRPGGLVDLGDLRLEPPPLLASGQVVDGRGEPVAGARVAVDLAWPDALLPSLDAAVAELAARGSFDAAQLEAQRAHHASRREQRRFELVAALEVEADADGRFEVRTAEPALALRLAAQREGAISEPVVVDPGVRDVELRLFELAELEGRVLLPEGLSPARILVQLEPVFGPGERGKAYTRPNVELRADGTWRAQELEPRTWSVRVADREAFGWEALGPAVRVEALPGELARAPDLDLRGVVRGIGIEVVDESGAPLGKGSGVLGSYSGVGSGNNNDIEVVKGRARIWTHHAEAEAWIGAPGRRCVHLRPLEDGARVVLAPALPVRLALADPAALPAPPYELVAQLDAALRRGSWTVGQLSLGGVGAFDASGEALLGSPAPGEVTVRVGVRDPRTGGGGPRLVWLRTPARLRIAVADQLAEQRFELALDPELVQRTRAELEGQRP